MLVSGSGTNMAALLYASRQPGCPYEVVLVSGDKADCGGIALAEAEGVPVVRLPALPKAELFPALDEAIRHAGAEYIALAGFMRVLPADFVARWEGRILNIHPSLLPKYKGLHTHQRAIEARDLHAIGWAIACMLVGILMYDQLLFRPLVAWADCWWMTARVRRSKRLPDSWCGTQVA